MKKDKKFIPLVHENLQLKNTLINFARDQKSKTGTENQLAAAFIYATFAEYVADHLLQTLRHFIYDVTYKQFAALLFIDERNIEDKMPLGTIIRKLDAYSFPDKTDISALLKKICDCRNNVFHNMAKISPEDAAILDRDIKFICEYTEELFTKINVVYKGLELMVYGPHKPAQSHQEKKDTESK